MSSARHASTLLIAASDASGSRHLQADLATCHAHGVHAASAVSALGLRRGDRLQILQTTTPHDLRAQIDAGLADGEVLAVKVGWLADAQAIDCVAAALREHRPGQIVLDPHWGDDHGPCPDDLAQAWRRLLLPLATVVAIGAGTAARLLGIRIEDATQAERAVASLLDQGAAAVLLGGGQLRDGARVVDRFDDGVTQDAFIHARLEMIDAGAGDRLSAALTARLAQGLACANACEAAVDHVVRVLQARQAEDQAMPATTPAGGQA